MVVEWQENAKTKEHCCSNFNLNLLESLDLVWQGVEVALCLVATGAGRELGNALDGVGSGAAAQIVCLASVEEVLLNVLSHLHLYSLFV